MLLAFSIAPLGAGESVTEAVADAVAIVRESGLPYRLDSMFTTVEGDWDEVLAVVRRASDVLTERGHRVSLVMKADIRPGRSGELTGKVERVEQELDRRTSTV
ncbi:MTH1187 family thiamine-binding protein [Ruania albidiflava]|uniref:MTH1187 family thiamine-binding protein n=1 Tax=Ruania albidiflava TaxID=366586 RepID=UPI0004845C7C|nr:MTH1187 family thiamine-binding protein [Ruania albidiflava]